MNMFFNSRHIDMLEKCKSIDVDILHHENSSDDEKRFYIARKYMHNIINLNKHADDKSISNMRLFLNKTSSIEELQGVADKECNSYSLRVQKLKKIISKDLVNKDIDKYQRLVEMYLKKYVQKNWNEATMSKAGGGVSLGNSGFTMDDIRQQLRMEVAIAIGNYNPDYRTKDGRSVKESTFVYTHLFNRIGQLMKKLTKKRYGYGMWMSNLEEVLWETDRDG